MHSYWRRDRDQPKQLASMWLDQLAPQIYSTQFFLSTIDPEFFSPNSYSQIHAASKGTSLTTDKESVSIIIIPWDPHDTNKEIHICWPVSLNYQQVLRKHHFFHGHHRDILAVTKLPAAFVPLNGLSFPIQWFFLLTDVQKFKFEDAEGPIYMIAYIKHLNGLLVNFHDHPLIIRYGLRYLVVQRPFSPHFSALHLLVYLSRLQYLSYISPVAVEFKLSRLLVHRK